MFINPRTAIAEGWVTFPAWMTEEQKEKCIQPNALDFTLDHVNAIRTDVPFILYEDKSKVQHRRLIEVAPSNGVFHLVNQFESPLWGGYFNTTKYDFQSDFYVNLPEGVAALVIVRSTLNRNGLFITTGLWDSGFKGHIAGVLHNTDGEAHIEEHVRIGQIMFIKSEFSGALYAGGYNTEAGQHWTTRSTQ